MSNRQEKPPLFQPTRPLRGATLRRNARSVKKAFQPTRPLRGATDALNICGGYFPISTHAPLAGRDESRRFRYVRDRHFNPRAPCGARRLKDVFFRALYVFQPTRPLRGATRTVCSCRVIRNISTHAPLAGRDAWTVIQTGADWVFQPTRPLRGATAKAALRTQHVSDFNPRAPCGARLPCT